MAQILDINLHLSLSLLLRLLPFIVIKIYPPMIQRNETSKETYISLKITIRNAIMIRLYQ